MFIVWGTKVRFKKLGFVADFCPVCQQVERFTLAEVRHIGHLYYISLGWGKVVGHRIKCCACKDEQFVDFARYSSVSDDGHAEVVALTEETNPSVLDEIAERLEKEERIRSGAASAEDRLSLIAAPFLQIAAPIQVRAAQQHIDKVAGLWLFATFVIPVALLIAAGSSNPGPGQSALQIAAAVAFGVCGLVTLIALHTDVPRLIKRKYDPFIRATLRSLEPTQEELEQILADLKAQKLAVGKQFNARKLHQSLLADR